MNNSEEMTVILTLIKLLDLTSEEKLELSRILWRDYIEHQDYGYRCDDAIFKRIHKEANQFAIDVKNLA